MLKAGVSKQVVTPPTWVPYLTSSGNGTCAPFDGVHDELHARAMVLDDGANAICVLAVDAIGYDNSILGENRDFTRELRDQVSRETGLDRASVMLCATHSHSTPETIGLTSSRDVPGVSTWLDEHLSRLVNVVVDAYSKRVPVRAYSSIRSVQGVSRNRRIVLKDGTLDRRGDPPDPAKVDGTFPVDEDLFTLYLETENGDPFGVMLNYTAHPVVAMLLPSVSADYPGATSTRVEEALGGAVCLFTNGACGNVNSLHVSTNFEDVHKLGGLLAEAALLGISELKSEDILQEWMTHSATMEIELSPRPCPPLEQAQAALDLSDSRENRRMLRLARKVLDGPLHGEIQLMRLGRLIWLALPGEVFVETGISLKLAGATFVAGNSNGWLGYFPTRGAYEEGGYEVTPGVWSRVAPGSAELIEAWGKQMLGRLST
jgi:neutral ceramidase